MKTSLPSFSLCIKSRREFSFISYFFFLKILFLWRRQYYILSVEKSQRAFDGRPLFPYRVQFSERRTQFDFCVLISGKGKKYTKGMVIARSMCFGLIKQNVSHVCSVSGEIANLMQKSINHSNFLCLVMCFRFE